MTLRLFVVLITSLFLLACSEESGLPREFQDETQGEEKEESFPLTPTDAVAGIPFTYELPQIKTLKNPNVHIVRLPVWVQWDEDKQQIVGTPTHSDVSAYQPFEVRVSGELGGEKFARTYEGHFVVYHTAAVRKNNKIDYYDTPFDNQARQYRNDLQQSELKGEVQFLQTHASTPSKEINHHVVKNDETKSQYMPNIVALREALLLFLPELEEEPITLHAKINVPGKPELVLAMKHPNDLFAVDKPAVSQLHYSKRAWSAVLPWDYVNTGLSIEFIVNQDAPTAISGELPSSAIDVDLATQLEMQFVRLGMLVDPVAPNNNHFMLNDPILAATDYFQTVPVSRLVVGAYTDMKLNSAIVNQGGKARVYDIHSENPNDRSSDSTNADVYSGDLRENVAKSQVSVGINLANAGVTSWDLSQNYPHSTKIITNHHARGLYKCTGKEKCPENGAWVVEHGLSGGNGIGTIISSSGNEASHEWGHAYGLGHYPGNHLTPDGRWARHNPKSGWGYIGHRHRLRSNVFQIADKNTTQWGTNEEIPEQVPAGGFLYSRDAMSGAGSDTATPFSSYTFYSSYTARIIQQDLNKFNIADPSFATGYKKWNADVGEYQEAEAVGFRGQPGLAPKAVGVPVATILGGYDPEPHHYEEGEKRAVIYPVFHGNYGKVYDLPEPNLNGNEDACWVTVKGAGGTRHVAVSANRHSAGSINQLHFNLEASFKPTSATLFCRHNGEQTELAHTEFGGQIPELPPVAIVGQEQGYKQLKAREMKEIAEEIMALAPDNVMQAGDGLLTKIHSYDTSELEQELDAAAWGYVKALLEVSQNTANIEALINVGEAKGLSQSEMKHHLEDYLLTTGLSEGGEQLIPQGGVMYGFWGPYAAPQTAYLSTVPAEDGRLYVKPVSDGEVEQHRWVMDAQGRIHPERDLSLCLTATAPVTLTACETNNSAQKWAYNENNTLRAHGGTGQCMDNHASQGNHMNLI